MNNFIDRVKLDKQFKDSIIDSLSRNITNSDEFFDVINYVIDQKLQMIKESDKLYDDEDDDFLFLILPAIRRIWAKIYLDTPQIFKMPEIVTSVPGYVPDKRLELYQLSFNIDDFFDYMIEMFNKTKNLLNDFEYLDKTQETLTLIVDNYVAKMINDVTTCDDISQEIRNLKIRKIV